MNATEALKIPKREQPVILWSDGGERVHGTMFLNLHSEGHAGGQLTLDLLNDDEPFVILVVPGESEPRLYSKRRVVRVEHDESDAELHPEYTLIRCRLHLVGGASVEGTVLEPLPPEHCRLIDYLNSGGGRFIRLHLTGDRICLVNEAHIVHASELSGRLHG